MSKQHITMIFDFMQAHRLSQAEMAQRLEITPTTLSRWLSGKHGITKKNKNAIEFICGKQKDEITNKIIEAVENLTKENKWSLYEYIIKTYK